MRVWRRHAELLHRESPLLTLTLQHRTKVRMMMMVILVLIMAMRTQVGVVVQYSSSQLTDFTGLLYQDSLSHRHLNLRLILLICIIIMIIVENKVNQLPSSKKCFCLREPVF